MAGGERRDEGSDAVLQQPVHHPRDGGGERVGVSDDDQSRFHPPGELEAEGWERACHLLRGGVRDICAIRCVM